MIEADIEARIGMQSKLKELQSHPLRRHWIRQNQGQARIQQSNHHRSFQHQRFHHPEAEGAMEELEGGGHRLLSQVGFRHSLIWIRMLVHFNHQGVMHNFRNISPDRCDSKHRSFRRRNEILDLEDAGTAFARVPLGKGGQVGLKSSEVLTSKV